MRVHREFDPALITRANIKFHGGKWLANLSAEVEVPTINPVSSGKSVGIDMGLEYFAVLSDCTFIKTPKHYRRAERKLAKLQRQLSRKKKGSNNRGKAIAKVARLHVKVANQRKDFLHKESLKVVKQYDIIIMEDLKIKNMVRNKKLAKSIHDAGWGQFGSYIAYKSIKYGKTYLKVPPYGTSQTCLCGANVPKDLSIRIHRCPVCGLVEQRDLVSAKLIERRGQALVA